MMLNTIIMAKELLLVALMEKSTYMKLQVKAQKKLQK